MANLSRALASLTCACLVVAQTAQATCAIGDASQCISQRAPDGSIVQFPRLVWTSIASAERDPTGHGFQFHYLQGGLARVTRNESAVALGIPGSQVSGIFRQPANTPPIVFARFAPGSNQLRIDLLRIERGIDGRVTVADAVFGPHHGERFISQQAFLTASDRRAGKPGINPLAGWKSGDDNIFHDICLQCPNGRNGIDPYTSGVATALGIAMRQVGAQLGILAVAHEWFDVQEQSSGGLLRSTVTVKVSGYARPDWWIASPVGAQLGGSSGLGICAVNGETPCHPEHVVAAGIQLAPWAGPGLPTDQDRLYYSESSHSGMTVLGYALVTAALVGLGAFAAGADLLGSSTLEEASMSVGTGGAGVVGTSALTGAIGGTSYVLGSELLHPGAPDQIQNGYLGSKLSGGDLMASQPASNEASTLQTKATELQIRSPLSAGLAGVRSMYEGNCPDSRSRIQCAEQSQGTVPRLGDKTSR